MPSDEALLARIRGEFAEMPGLRLTPKQACRLFQIDPVACGRLLERLVTDGTLWRSTAGLYGSLTLMRPRPARADLSSSSQKLPQVRIARRP